MLEGYRKHVEKRSAMGTPPLARDAEHLVGFVVLLKTPPAGSEIS